MVEMNLYEIQQWKERIKKHMEELFLGVEQLKNEFSELDTEMHKRYFDWFDSNYKDPEDMPF